MEAKPNWSNRADLEALVALSSLDKLGPVRLRWLLGNGRPADVVASILSTRRLSSALGPSPRGVTADLVASWVSTLGSLDVRSLFDRQTSGGIQLVAPGHPHWPLVNDPDPPAILFCRGDTALLSSSCLVAIVGTRRCSSVGRQFAFRLGAELSEAGVEVVSGLALGVDSAAHSGALSSRGHPVGIVGSGLDVVYPKSNIELWDKVGERGLLISESSNGTQPQRWRFPARNRIIAAISLAVVVVESHLAGGALSTAAEAADRGVPVLAVPGSVLSSASAGTNQLLADGCPPVTATEDVLDVIDVERASRWADSRPGSSAAGSCQSVEHLDDIERSILAEARAGTAHVDQLVALTRLPVAAILAAIQRLSATEKIIFDGSLVSLNSLGEGTDGLDSSS